MSKQMKKTKSASIEIIDWMLAIDLDPSQIPFLFFLNCMRFVIVYAKPQNTSYRSKFQRRGKLKVFNRSNLRDSIAVFNSLVLATRA